MHKNSYEKNLELLFLFFVMCAISSIYYSWFVDFDFVARGDLKARGAGWYSNYDEISAWDVSDFGGINSFYGGLIIRYPIYHLYSLLSDYGITYGYISRIMWFYPFLILSVIGPFYLLKHYYGKQGLFIPSLGVLFFLANNYIVFRSSGGQVMFIIAYAIWPSLFLMYLRALNSENWNKKIFYFISAGVIASISGYHEFRVTFSFIIVMILYGVIRSLRDVRNIIVVIMVPLIFVGLNFWWILPVIEEGYSLSPDITQGKSFFSSGILMSLSRSSILDSMSFSLGTSSPPFTYFKSQLNELSVFFIAMITTVPIILSYMNNKFIIEKREITILLTLFLLLVFFIKGVNQPLSFLNYFVYEKIPFSSSYRLPSKFFITLSIFYMILFVYSIVYINKNISSKKYMIVTNFVIASIIIYGIYPAIFSENRLIEHEAGSSFNGYLSDQYFDIEKKLKGQNGKIVWIPSTSYYFGGKLGNQYYSLYHQEKIKPINIENFIDLKVKFNENAINYFYNLGVGYVIIMPDDDPQWYWEDRNFVKRKMIKFFNRIDSMERINFNDNIVGYKMKHITEEINPNIILKCIPKNKNDLYSIERSEILMYFDDDFCQLNTSILSNNSEISLNFYNDKHFNYSVIINEFKNEYDNVVIHFNQNYSKFWRLKLNGKLIKPYKTAFYTNVFVMSKDDLSASSGEFSIIYKGNESLKRYYNMFEIIFVCVFILMVIFYWLSTRVEKIK